MAKLSDLQLASILEEIASAMRTDSPIIESMRRLQDRRLGRVATAAATIAAELERGQGVSQAILAVSSPLADQASAAITASERSGESELLDGMAIQLRRRSEFARSYTLAWFYPILLLGVGYAVAVGVMSPMVQRFNGRDVAWPAWVLEASVWLQQNWYWPPIAMLAVIVLMGIWRHSRVRFPRCVRLGLFCQTLAEQISHDVPEDQAILCAARMSGDEELSGIANPTLTSPPVADVLSGEVTHNVQLEGTTEKQLLTARLRYLAAIHAERARRQAVLWCRVVPRIAMIVIGGGLTLSLVWWVIAPVYREVAQW